MPLWEAQDIAILIQQKQQYPHASWEYIARIIGNRHTPSACKARYRQYKPPLPSHWTPTQRYYLAKLRASKPPLSWNEITSRVDHPPEECEEVYRHQINHREIVYARGVVEGEIKRAEQIQLKMDLHPIRWGPIVGDRRNKHWTQGELVTLIRMRLRGHHFDDIAQELHRTSNGVSFKWYSFKY
ncbi:hypothetical protein BDB00DRAFT_867574 [Zychaea mexicana]|uniref:uncharacterized protein n=1 Tax=Zychaea mexicana TaxID=64656 RepID=UPI0022FF34DA|nr:uncharacterized protein BDB00DRAFT_867574 [Zychaea mexicana]KAI9498423.1 hypothetical protein BDB00DRAFT_867574 [Zychaea mexicana]